MKEREQSSRRIRKKICVDRVGERKHYVWVPSNTFTKSKREKEKCAMEKAKWKLH